MTAYEVTTGKTGLDSSVFDEVHYDEDSKVLYLTFKNGRLAAYRDVSSSTYESFVNYESMGQFYNYYIQPRFKGVSVDQGATFVIKGTNIQPTVPAVPAEELYDFLLTYDYKVVVDRKDATVQIKAANFDEAVAKLQAQAQGRSDIKVTKAEVSFV